MKHILVVDDNKINLAIAKRELTEKYQVTLVTSGFQALQFLEKKKPDLILLDIIMPEMDGKDTMKKIRANDEWARIPIIFLTADSTPETEAECLALGADDFIAKPFVPMVMHRRISRIIELNELRYDLETQLELKTRQVEKVTLNSIMAIANTIDAKDKYTCGHSARVARCAEEIARRLNWSEEELQNLHYVALLHDIGKIGVPDSILNKPTRLSDSEFAIIKKHPITGSEILKDIKMLEHVEEGALYHHERWDGSGYPFGLSGEDIPLMARIVGVADAYDAMTSNRVYRPKLSNEAVLAEFEKCCGTQFDPTICKVFIEMLKEGFTVPYMDNVENDDIVDESGKLLSKVLNEYTTDIKNKAMTDALTGLYNRSYTENRVSEMVGNGQAGSLFMIDMDNFKHINDNYGHIAGDITLKTFADTLRANSGENDILCRIGGDEFVVFYPEFIEREAVAERARMILDCLAGKLEQLGYGNVTSVSIGIAVCPADGEDFTTLYNNADKALYHVKRNGKSSYQFFSEGKSGSEEKTVTDLDHVRTMIEAGMREEAGALNVEYKEFRQIYNYISRYISRNNQAVQTVLFTCSGKNGQYPETTVLEDVMNKLENSIVLSLRAADVSARYSSSQYIVILMDADIENGKMVAQRITEQFYREYSGQEITLSYNIQTMQSQ